MQSAGHDFHRADVDRPPDTRGAPRWSVAGGGLVFVHWHQTLNVAYCLSRLLWYRERCSVQVSPHQLRHSAAALLLNAGTPVLTAQLILGHKKIDTTLG